MNLVAAVKHTSVGRRGILDFVRYMLLGLFLSAGVAIDKAIRLLHCALLLQRNFEHPDLAIELIMHLLAMPYLAFLLCNLCLHLGALDVP